MDDGASRSAAAAGPAGDGGYDCNICLELAQDPVVTMCGHLFCWPCLYRWLASRGECPVCKSAVESSKVVPIYGRGKGSTDPRTKPVPGVDDDIPNRPAGRRTEVPRDHHHHHHPPQPPQAAVSFSIFAGPAATAQFGNVAISAGVGIVPLLFSFMWPWSGWGGLEHQRAAAAGATSAGSGGSNVQDARQEELLWKMFILVGVFVLVCLFFF